MGRVGGGVAGPGRFFERETASVPGGSGGGVGWEGAEVGRDGSF